MGCHMIYLFKNYVKLGRSSLLIIFRFLENLKLLQWLLNHFYQFFSYRLLLLAESHCDMISMAKRSSFSTTKYNSSIWIEIYVWSNIDKWCIGIGLVLNPKIEWLNVCVNQTYESKITLLSKSAKAFGFDQSR